MVCMALFIMTALFKPRIIEGLANPSPVTTAVANTCSCANYDATLADLQNQVNTLSTQVNSAINDTKSNIQNVSDGLSKLGT
jgi:hypothetical protein